MRTKPSPALRGRPSRKREGEIQDIGSQVASGAEMLTLAPWPGAESISISPSSDWPRSCVMSRPSPDACDQFSGGPKTNPLFLT